MFMARLPFNLPLFVAYKPFFGIFYAVFFILTWSLLFSNPFKSVPSPAWSCPAWACTINWLRLLTVSTVPSDSVSRLPYSPFVNVPLRFLFFAVPFYLTFNLDCWVSISCLFDSYSALRSYSCYKRSCSTCLWTYLISFAFCFSCSYSISLSSICWLSVPVLIRSCTSSCNFLLKVILSLVLRLRFSVSSYSLKSALSNQTQSWSFFFLFFVFWFCVYPEPTICMVILFII